MTDFICQRCRNVVTIPRRKRKLREKGHIKTMWCWKCKKDTQHRMR